MRQINGLKRHLIFWIKNKTSYDALSVVVLFISSARRLNMFLLDNLVLSDRLSLDSIESNVNVNISFTSL